MIFGDKGTSVALVEKPERGGIESEVPEAVDHGVLAG